ncbi:MAG: hypothetical protein Q8R58_12690 [Sulfuricurvum sp.]|nr:hypothetical protein [Sulfuricurvum sp.]
MARPKKLEHEKIQYKRDYVTKSIRLDLRTDIETMIAKFLESLPNYNQFIKIMIVNTNLFDKFSKESHNDDFYGDGANGKYGFV